ncbi:hypothetical protein [Sciscionella sediminilitoris]|uniref:hypothetical protein n=1 Tax=Sciscionella sediminilitoris TaxID=1445613 RepID=UPI0004DF9E38|nr:hypothetical protein [Sciscionella sp. SE31]
MPVYNLHERRLPVPAERAAPLLDGLSGERDLLWPVEHWPPMRFDGPLAVGADGGHGPVRYAVEEYIPGRLVRFRFRAPRGFDGIHEFTVHPSASGGTVLRHLLAMRTTGPARLSWPLVFRHLHDACLEDCFDRAERTLTGTVGSPAHWNRYTRLLHAVLARIR